MSDLGETRCSCCGITLAPGSEYYYQDDEGNDVTDSPLCCECAA